MKPFNEGERAGGLTRREAIERVVLLLGVAISPSILAGALQAQPGLARAVEAKPEFLSAPQFAAVSAMAERILPRSETPGAIDVGVPAFIDLMIGKFMTGAERQIFMAGIVELEAKARARASVDFARMTPAAQDALLKEVATLSQNREKTFFHQLKELTLLGYFTSETVGKNFLHYDPIPGRFDACIPLETVGNRAWTR